MGITDKVVQIFQCERCPKEQDADKPRYKVCMDLQPVNEAAESHALPNGANSYGIEKEVCAQCAKSLVKNAEHMVVKKPTRSGNGSEQQEE